MEATLADLAPGAVARPAPLRRLLDAVDTLLARLACLMLFAMMCVVVLDVALRYFLNAPLQWSYQVISSYLMPGLFFLTVSHALKSHAHVAVDLLHSHVSRRTRRVFELISCVLATPVFAICTWVSGRNTWADFAAAAVSTSGLPVPSWTLSLFLPLGFGLLTLRLLANAVDHLATLTSGRERLALPPIAGREENA